MVHRHYYLLQKRNTFLILTRRVGHGHMIDLNGSLIDTTLNFDVTGLQPGGHVLYIRLQNSFNYWSINYQQNIFLPLNADSIHGLSYFVDSVQNRISLPLRSTALLDTVVSIHIPDNGANSRMLGLQLTGPNGLIGNAQLDTVNLCDLYKPVAGFRYSQYGAIFTMIDTSKFNTSGKIKWLVNNTVLDSSYTVNYLYPDTAFATNTTISEAIGTGCRADTVSKLLNVSGVEYFYPFIGSYNSDFDLDIYGGGLDTSLNIFLQRAGKTVYPYLKISQDGGRHLIAVFDFHSDSLVNNSPVFLSDGYKLHVQYSIPSYEYTSPDSIYFVKAFDAAACSQISAAFLKAHIDFTGGAPIWQLAEDYNQVQNLESRCPPAVKTVTNNSSEPNFATDLTGPSDIRVGEWNNFTLSITNTGTVVAKGIPFYFLVPAFFDIDTTQWNILTNDPAMRDSISVIVNIDTLIDGQPFQYKLIPMIYPVLAPGETGYFPLRIRATTDNSYNIFYGVQSRIFGSPMTDDFGPCWGAVIDFALGFVPGVSCVYSFGNLINDGVNAHYGVSSPSGFSWTLSIAGTLVSCIPGGGPVKQIATAGAKGFAEAVLGSAQDIINIIDKHLNVISNVTSASTSSDPCKKTNQGSKDKNGKTGTARDPNNIVGNSDYDSTKNYINNYSPQFYTVNFENKPSATADAQHVYVTDTLEKDKLNFLSFNLSQFYIGDSIYSLPPNRNTITEDVWLKGRNDMKVRFSAAFDTAKGILQADFFSIDTSGHVLPTDSLAGFLPPDIDGNSGRAGLSYLLYARNLNTLDSFSNKASIYFDNNDPITTNTWINTIDTTGPQTKILSAIPLNDSTVKLVIQQSDVGSGNKFNDLYGKLSTDTVFNDLGIAYGDTVLFKSTPGATYQLYVLGTDNVNNKESKNPTGEVTYTFGSNPLPLSWLSFTGKKVGSRVQLNWTTANEINTSHFDIEKATDSSGYVLIGTEMAKGNTGHNNDYVSFDDHPVYGNNFYRLKEFDIDGKFIYSSIVLVRYDQNGYVIIAPNPAKDYVSIKSNEIFSQIQLIDMNGRIIRTYSNSTNNIYSLSGISKGLYYLRLIGTTDSQTHKLLIQ